MTDATKGTAGDYHALEINGSVKSKASTYGNNSVVSTFFVYSAWSVSTPFVSTSDEPRLGHGIAYHGEQDLITETLLAGALFSSCRDPMRKFERYEWRHYLYLAGLVVLVLGFVLPSHGLLETYVDEILFEDIGDWVIGVALAIIFWLIALIVHAWAVWRLEVNMTAAVESLNYPLFQLAGYRAHYRVEPTGPCYTLEHRIYVLLDQTKASGSLLELMPDSTRPLFADGKTVYLHTASMWGDDNGKQVDKTSQYENNKIYLHRHDQPAMLKSIHPFLWGAIHQAFWVEEMDRLRQQRRVRIGDTLVAALLAFLWAMPALGADQQKAASGGTETARLVLQSWLLVLVVILAIIAFYVIFLKVLLNRSAETVGHVKWARATATWGPVLANLGWRLDYNFPNSLAPAQGTGTAVATAVDESNTNTNEYFLRFVPVAETRTPVGQLLKMQP